MGALPKRKLSKARKGRRKSHLALKTPTVVNCPKCGKPKRAHFKCEFCGHYGKYERKTTKVEVEKKSKE